MSTRLVWLVALFTACEPPPTPGPQAPAAPVFAPLVSPTPFSVVTLKADAPPDTVVRVFVDDACAGPVLFDAPSAKLAVGVPVSLVPRSDNVFTARAVSLQGLRSECSAPVGVRFEPKDRPGAPVVHSEPASPARTSRFRLVGKAPDAELVQVFADACGGALLASVSREDFESVGVPVEVVANTFRTFFIQSIDVTRQRSSCASLVLLSDVAPPGITSVNVGSPNPGSEPQARLVVNGTSDLLRVDAFFGHGCRGAPVASDRPSAGTFGVVATPVVPLSDGEYDWSIRGFDALGNSVCVDASEPLVSDFTLAPAAPVLRANGVLLESRIPVWLPGATVRYFAAADCEGPVAWEKSQALAVQPVFVDPGTVWSARMVSPFLPFADGKCSNTALIPSN
jgi:hypothetical protein